jgi:hypothetical protein
MQEERSELILSREYRRGEQRQWIHLRKVTVTNGTNKGLFRFETWQDGQENPSLRLELGDVYAMQRKFIARLIDMYADGWKREQMLKGEPGVSEYIEYFNVAGI